MMKLRIFLFISLATLITATAQVGIGTDLPATGSLLHLVDSDGTNDSGLLINKVNITDLATVAPLPTGAEEGIMVYNTNTTTGKGFYFWSGTRWQALMSNSDDESIYNGNGSLEENREIDAGNNILQVSSDNGMNAFTLRRKDNADQLGLTFRNSGMAYDAAMYLTPNTQSSLVFATRGNQSVPTDLLPSLEIDDAGQLKLPAYQTTSFLNNSATNKVLAVNPTNGDIVIADGEPLRANIYTQNGSLPSTRTLDTNNEIFEIRNNAAAGASAITPALTITENASNPGTAAGGSITLQRNSNASSSSIVFRSLINRNSDFAYLRYEDNGSPVSSSSENSLFTIGVQNDPQLSTQVDNINIDASGSLGINNNAPHLSASIDFGRNDQGVLINRVALTSRTIAAPVPAPQDGLLIFNTSTNGSASNAVIPGFYFWDNSQWNKINSGNEHEANIYNSDGALNQDRRINSNGHQIIFQAVDTGRRLQIIPAAAGNNDNPFTVETNNSLRLDIDGQRGLEVEADRQVRLGNEYATGNFTGTPTHKLLSDSNGRIIQEDYTPSYSAKFNVASRFTENGSSAINVNVPLDNANGETNELPLFGIEQWNDDSAIATRQGTTDSANDFIISRAGRYKIIVNLSFQSVVNRPNVDVLLKVTRGGNDLYPSAKHSTAYIRNTGNHNHSSVSFTEVVNLQSGDDLSVIAIQEAGNGILRLRNAIETPGVVSSVFIELIK